jgi:hypothetical protein
MSLYPNSIPRCEHLKINGTQCESPALKRNHYCYFHKRWQDARIVLNANRARRGRPALDLPVLEDANSIQVSLMQIMRLILSGQIDPKTAGLLLYALQTASSNLRRVDFEPVVKTRVVIDPKTVDQTSLGEDPWDRDDFEDEEEDDQEEASDEEDVEAGPEDVGVDKEWSAEETIPEIEAQAEPEKESEQIIPQIQAVANHKGPRDRRLPRIQGQRIGVSASAACPVECSASHPVRKGRGKNGAPSVLLFDRKARMP